MRRIFPLAILAGVLSAGVADAGPVRNLAKRIKSAVQNRPLLFRPVALTRATVAAAVVPLTKAKPHCAECEKAMPPAKK